MWFWQHNMTVAILSMHLPRATQPRQNRQQAERDRIGSNFTYGKLHVWYTAWGWVRRTKIGRFGVGRRVADG